ncbi:dephospho-CoA kinase [Adhaeribacter pallidiroseus]|uniref:Dephospho-CoA kinase n=1 Tax=Adhaeribacter pallidiroseus TaxID=2072847 RepID=A0A369QJ12_9BACT|nr:dephospho-CoA kinase [Adhaeribacter pallidiroseus]RDC62278.1 Dephospho-CoA kinase [Adhaeribacter pallidiroseus]
MLKLGITGGIGSGKSLICRVFALLGIPVYDSDGRAKWVMQYLPELQQELRTAFGPNAFDANTGLLNRAYLAQLVFQNPERLAVLNGLVHPRVKQDFTDWAAAQTNAPYLIKEAALMYETEAHKQVDKMVLVTAPEPLRITRTLRRDSHRTALDVQAIMQKQLTDEEKIKRVDFVIRNDEQQLIIPQVLAIHHQLVTEVIERPTKI